MAIKPEYFKEYSSTVSTESSARVGLGVGVLVAMSVIIVSPS